MNTQNNKELLYGFVDAFLANAPHSTSSSAGINDQLLKLGSRLDETNRLIADSIKSSDRQFGEVRSQFDDIKRQVDDVKRQVDDVKHQVGDVKRQVVDGKQQSDRQFQDLQASLEYYSRLAHARSFNSCAHLDKGVLHPLPDGRLPAPGTFPVNTRAFCLLITEPAELEKLLRLYGQPVHDSSLVNHTELK